MKALKYLSLCVLSLASLLASACFLIPELDEELPSCSITSPTDGASVSDTITVQVSASDNEGIAKVTLRIDTENVWVTDTQAPWEFEWNSSTVTIGEHTLTATAYDVSGNTQSSSITVTVEAGTGPVSYLEDFESYEPFTLDASHMDKWLKNGWDFSLAGTAQAAIEESSGNRYLLINDTFASTDYAFLWANLPALRRGTLSFRIWPVSGSPTNIFWGVGYNDPKDEGYLANGTILTTAASAGSLVRQAHTGGFTTLERDTWSTISIAFDLEEERLTVSVNGAPYSYEQALEGSAVANWFYLRSFSLDATAAALAPNLAYTKCRIDDVAFISTVADGAFPDALPAPAANRLWASSDVEGKIELQWDKVSGARGYKLYRKVDSNYELLETYDNVPDQAYYQVDVEENAGTWGPVAGQDVTFAVAAFGSTYYEGARSNDFTGCIPDFDYPADLQVKLVTTSNKVFYSNTFNFPDNPGEALAAGKHDVYSLAVPGGSPGSDGEYTWRIEKSELQGLWDLMVYHGVMNRSWAAAASGNTYNLVMTANGTTITVPQTSSSSADQAIIDGILDYINERIPAKRAPSIEVLNPIRRTISQNFVTVSFPLWDRILTGERVYHLERDSESSFNTASGDYLHGTYSETDGADEAVFFNYSANELDSSWLSKTHYTRVWVSIGGVSSYVSETKSSSVTN